MHDSRRAVRIRVGRRVRQLRLLRGLNQERLAELVGNTQKHLSEVERGRVNVTIDILSGIADHLAVDAVDLFEPAPGERRGAVVYRITGRELAEIERALRLAERVRRAAARRQPHSRR